MLLKSRIVRIAVASLLSGALIGVVGGFFRLALIIADRWRGTLIAWAVGQPYFGWLTPLMLAASGAALARLLVVRFAPEAEGSGVQRVEAVFNGEVKEAGAAVIPVKFVGGVAAIGCGLALGREGPTVQMGSSLATLVAGLAAVEDEDARVIDAAGAGAGLAVAFNAPLGGSILVFEELTSRFTSMLLVATLAAAFAAVRVMRLMLGDHMDFAVK